MGKGVARALATEGFEVYGTTRSAASASSLEAIGVKPIVANYVVRADVDRAIAESGATQLVFFTDFFTAAKGTVALEEEQGLMVIEAAKAASSIDYVIFLSAADADLLARDPRVHHMHAKVKLESAVQSAGLKGYTILRPAAFFENLDDPANWNPLSKGSVKFLSEAPINFVSTYDVGKAAAVVLKDKEKWHGKTLSCASWRGTIYEVASALQSVSGVPTTGSLAMPIWLRWLFLGDLNAMCEFFEKGYPETVVSIEEFKHVVPDAMDAAAWFRYKGKYSNGEAIVKE
jgi:uncharacterized protein YbjT (DUF2867 family)